MLYEALLTTTRFVGVSVKSGEEYEVTGNLMYLAKLLIHSIVLIFGPAILHVHPVNAQSDCPFAGEDVIFEDGEEALTRFYCIIENHPEIVTEDIFVIVSMIHAEQSTYDLLLVKLLEYDEMYPDLEIIDAEIGFTYLQLGNAQEGTEFLSQISLPQDLANIYVDVLSELDFNNPQGEPDYAALLAYVDRGIYLSDEVPMLYGLQGYLLQLSGDSITAETSYRQGLELDNNIVELHYGLGNNLLSQDRYHEAIESYETALAIDEQFAPAWVNLGYTQSRIGRNENALFSLQTALEIDPSNELAYTAMILIHRELEDLQTAIEYAETLIDINPENRQYYCLLGSLYLANEDGIKAAENYQLCNTE
jgi:tetratricopeptide (TPR) repeat protein